MKRPTEFAALLLLAVSASAQGAETATSTTTVTQTAPSGPQWGGRVGVVVGQYKGEFELLGQSEGGDFELTYGLSGGVSAAVGNFIFDLGLELLRQDLPAEEVDRTDLLPSVSYLIGRHGVVFLGYRLAQQGDGPFNDDLLKENGFFVGAGLGGLPAGPLLLSPSAAYNLSEVEVNDDPDDVFDEFDYDGVSLKLGLALQRAPQHSVELRYQRFNGDVDLSAPGLPSATAELTETYVQATYFYRFRL